MTLDISDYYPPNSTYFYCYPSPYETKFFNKIPIPNKELVSARPLVCTSNMPVITFSSATTPFVRKILRDSCGLDLLSDDRVIPIDSFQNNNNHLTERDWDSYVLNQLKSCIPQGTLIMAEPFEREAAQQLFQIPVEVSKIVNDKNFLHENFSSEYLPKLIAKFTSGRSFVQYKISDYDLPCVIKVAASCAGDGVQICKNPSDILNAQNRFKNIEGKILIEKYLQVHQNVGIQFAIPYNSSNTIDIWSVHRQLVTRTGESLGGIVPPRDSRMMFTKDHSWQAPLQNFLLKVRRLGWYGIGGMDMLIDESGQFNFIDPNLRMTATTAFTILSHNMGIKKSLFTFMATFTGSRSMFIRLIEKFSQTGKPNQILQLSSLIEFGPVLHFDGAILFESVAELREISKKLINHGIQSIALENMDKLVDQES